MRQPNAVLHFVVLFAEHGKIVVYAIDLLSFAVFAASVPQKLFLALGELLVRFVYRKTERCHGSDKKLLPFRGFRPNPAGYGVFINGKRRIGNNQLFGKPYRFAESFAGGACAGRIIEIEQSGGGLLKGNSVQFEAIAVCFARNGLFLLLFDQVERAAPLVESELGGIRQTALHLLIIVPNG